MARYHTTTKHPELLIALDCPLQQTVAPVQGQHAPAMWLAHMKKELDASIDTIDIGYVENNNQ